MSILSGLSAFSLTPIDGEGRVDTEHLQRLVARLAGADVASIGVLGSTGSYMYLSAAERARAISAAVEAAGATPVLAGVGDIATARVLGHVRAAEKAGAAALLLAPVSYLPLTEDEVAGLAETVAQSTSLPVCLYNNPGTTHFTITEQLVARLAKVDGIAAVKNPAPLDPGEAASGLAQLRSKVPDGFVCGYSGDAMIAPVLDAGADAWYSVLAGTLPDLAKAIWSAAPQDRADIFASCGDLWTLFNRHGSIRVTAEIAALIGLGPLPLPAPLQPLPPTTVAEIEATLETIQTLLKDNA